MILIAQTETSTGGDLLGFLLPAVVILIAIAAIVFVQLRKASIAAGQQDDLRRLVDRYEQLAENILDAQQRVAADITDMGHGRHPSSRSCERSSESAARRPSDRAGGADLEPTV